MRPRDRLSRAAMKSWISRWIVCGQVSHAIFSGVEAARGCLSHFLYSALREPIRNPTDKVSKLNNKRKPVCPLPSDLGQDRKELVHPYIRVRLLHPKMILALGITGHFYRKIINSNKPVSLRPQAKASTGQQAEQPSHFLFRSSRILLTTFSSHPAMCMLFH